MIKVVLFLVQFTFILSTFCEANSIISLPQPNDDFTLSYIQNVNNCSYTVVISTSCSSPSYTRDQISISFGDAYGNQVYAPRIDDPFSKVFEACSSDTFKINGSCTSYPICYVFLYRTGDDGWKPDTVKISSYNAKTVSFNYSTWTPADQWYGFNLCSNTSSSPQLHSWRWFVFVVLGFLLSALL